MKLSARPALRWYGSKWRLASAEPVRLPPCVFAAYEDHQRVLTSNGWTPDGVVAGAQQRTIDDFLLALQPVSLQQFPPPPAR